MKTLFANISNNIHLLWISAIGVISPIKPLLLTVGFLIFADFIFGIYRAYRCKEPISSRKMGNSISKIVLYNIMIISVFLLNKYVIDTGLPLEKIATGLIGVIEIKSIDESFVKIYGWSIWDKLKKVINRGTSTTKDLIDDVENNDKS